MPGCTYTVFPTPAGWIGVLGSDRGLKRLVLPQPTAGDALHLLLRGPQEAINNDLRYLSLCRRIKDYLRGEPVRFSAEILDLEGSSPFQRAVWDVLTTIPYGETRTYRWVAEQAGRPAGARAAGQALASNPLPIIIPCHRVVAVRGLGGFSGGLPLKKALLDLEATRRPFAIP
ncbi:MAG: methylated-DNA--[protein]-cysteine S-methyltransferase [Chloroflexi bacterium]|nr:methylated-DNA--[protein]-cysteine S-methyltransferase [Chloroflexota bacterium]